MRTVAFTVAAAAFVVTAASLSIIPAGCARNEVAGVLARTTEVLDPAAIERVLRSHQPGEAVGPEGAQPRRVARTTLLLQSRDFSAHLLQIDSPLPRRLHRRHDLTLFVYRGAGDVIIEDLRRRARPGDLFHIPRSTPYLITPRGDGPLVLVAFFTPPLEGSDAVELPPDEPSYER